MCIILYFVIFVLCVMCWRLYCALNVSRSLTHHYKEALYSLKAQITKLGHK